MSEAGGLRRSAYRGAAATVAQQVLRLAAQIGSLVVLARILSPEDFGVYAMVMPIAAIVAIFRDMGLQDAVIQRREVTDAQINKLYWINVCLTAAIALTLIAVSPLVGAVYGEPRTVALTAALSLPVLIGGVAFQQYAMLARELRFVTLAVIDAACVLTGFVVAVAFALLWDSYWALWVSGVASAAVWTVAATAASSWRPSWPSFKAGTDGMLKFGANLTGVGIVNFLVENLDNMLIGRASGAVALGFYDRAYKLLLFPIQNVSRPIARVAIPILSRIQDQPARLRSGYLRILGQSNLATVPAVAAALAVHEELINVLLGPDWAPAAPLFAWLGIAALHQPTVSGVDWLLRVQGRADVLLRCLLAAGAVTVAAFFIGLPDGALGVARSFTIADCLFRLPLLVVVAGRVGAVRSADIALRLAPFVVAAVATYAVTQQLIAWGAHGPPLLALALVLSYGLAVLALLALPWGRAALLEVVGLALKGVRVLTALVAR